MPILLSCSESTWRGYYDFVDTLISSYWYQATDARAAPATGGNMHRTFPPRPTRGTLFKPPTTSDIHLYKCHHKPQNTSRRTKALA
jgi:hypothetical protein